MKLFLLYRSFTCTPLAYNQMQPVACGYMQLHAASCTQQSHAIMCSYTRSYMQRPSHTKHIKTKKVSAACRIQTCDATQCLESHRDALTTKLWEHMSFCRS